MLPLPPLSLGFGDSSKSSASQQIRDIKNGDNVFGVKLNWPVILGVVAVVGLLGWFLLRKK